MKELNPLILWGASGHSKVIREILEPLGYKTIALFDQAPGQDRQSSGIPIFCGEKGFYDWQSSYEGPDVSGAVAIGSPGQARMERQQFLGKHGIRIIPCCHPSASIAPSARLGTGCQVLAHAAISSEAALGDQCIVNTAASVDHESIVGCGVHVAPGARVLGCVEIGDYSFIGAGAVVLSRVKVGENTIVGAGAVVTKDVPANVVVFGSPATIQRKLTGPARPL